MGAPNLLLDSLIETAGLSHAGLAARINAASPQCQYDHASVARWIRDGAIPRHPASEIICKILGALMERELRPADIGMVRTEASASGISLTHTVEQARALWRADERGRVILSERQQPTTGANAVAPLFEWENPPPDLDLSRSGSRKLAQDDIADLIASRIHYEQMYRCVGGVPVRPRILKLLATRIAPMLDSCYDDATGRSLFRAVGGLVALVGVCAYDSEPRSQALAQRYFFHALRMAKASGDKAFGGYIVALLTNQAIFLGDFRLAIQYAETALRAGRGALSPALRTDLHAMQAKAYARIADHVGCYAQMQLTEASAAQINLANEPPETSYVQPGLIEVQHSEALSQVGDLVTAQRFAEESVHVANVVHPRGRVHRLANLSLVLSARLEIEHSAAVAQEALTCVSGMESWRVRDHVRDAARHLRPYAGNPEVDSVLDRARVILTYPR